MYIMHNDRMTLVAINIFVEICLREGIYGEFKFRRGSSALQ